MVPSIPTAFSASLWLWVKEQLKLIASEDAWIHGGPHDVGACKVTEVKNHVENPPPDFRRMYKGNAWMCSNRSLLATGQAHRDLHRAVWTTCGLNRTRPLTRSRRGAVTKEGC